MATIAGAGVRTGQGGDTKAQARWSMEWHRQHGLWLTSKPWEKHWVAGLTVIAAQSGDGRGRFMRGMAVDADTLGYDATVAGWLPEWQYAKRVTWEAQTFTVPPAMMCAPVERMLRVRSLTWLDDDELEEVLASLVVMR
jgi:hypothetical protein